MYGFFSIAYLPVWKVFHFIRINLSSYLLSGKEQMQNQCEQGLCISMCSRAVPYCIPEIRVSFFSGWLISRMCQILFRMWFSLSAPFSLSHKPRFSTKDVQNTVSMWNTSFKASDWSVQWAKADKSKLVTCRVSLHGACREQVQVDSLCMSRKSSCANTESLVCPTFFLCRGQLGRMGKIYLHLHINHFPHQWLKL